MAQGAGSIEPDGHSENYLLVFNGASRHASDVVGLLGSKGYRATLLDSASGVLQRFSSDRLRESGGQPPALLVILNGSAGGTAWVEMAARASASGTPVLCILDDAKAADSLLDRLADVDDWMKAEGLAEELPVRVARLLKQFPPNGLTKPIRQREAAYLGAHFMALMIHDLRSPLNVLKMTSAMLNMTMPKDDPNTEEDLQALEDNITTQEWLLKALEDYFALFQPGRPMSPSLFSPRRLVTELLEPARIGFGSKTTGVSLNVNGRCPAEALLDAKLAHKALTYALANAAVAAEGTPVRVEVDGSPGRWVTRVIIDQPPRECVVPLSLNPFAFERLSGIAAERSGLDLAITSKISELFGGSARLDAEPGRRTAIVLDWPTHPPESA